MMCPDDIVFSFANGLVYRHCPHKDGRWYVGKERIAPRDAVPLLRAAWAPGRHTERRH